MKKHLTAVFAAIFIFQKLPAQVLTTADVLATAGQETRFLQNQSLQQLAQAQNVQDPLLRQIALRVGINGSALGDTIYGYLRNEDTYQLQIGFNSLGEQQRQRHIKTTQVAAISAESRVLRQQALAERYEALAGYLFAAPKRAACQRLDTLLEKEHQILRDMLATGVLDVKVLKVLDAEEDRNRNRLALQELDNRLTLHRNRLRQFAGQFSELDRSDLVVLEDIRAHVAVLKAAPPALSPLFARKMADVALEKAKWNYVNAQNRQILNNFSVGYQHPLYLERPKNFNTFNNFNARLSITVPLPSNNRFKKFNALLDLRKAENEAIWTHEKTEKDLETQFVRLENLFKEFDFVQERLDNSLIRKMLDNPVLRNQITPLEIVEMEIAQQKLTITQAGLLADIAVEYVRLLERSGALAQDGAGNFLSTRK